MVLSHVTIMPVLLRPVNNFLDQVIGNPSEGKYNTVINSSSREVTFQKCLKSGITLFTSKNSNKSQTCATGAYQRLHEARPRLVVWLWEPEYSHRHILTQKIMKMVSYVTASMIPLMNISFELNHVINNVKNKINYSSLPLLAEGEQWSGLMVTQFILALSQG